MVDDEVVKTREYPTNDEFVEFLDIPKEYIMSGIAIQKMKKNVPFRYGPTITNYHWKCLSSPMLQFFAYSNLSLLLYFY